MKNNIWEDIIASNPRPYNKIITWDDKIEDSLLFESSSISYDSLGYIVKETSIINSLLRRLANIKNVMSIEDINIKKEIIGENNACLEFENTINGIHINGVDLITWNEDNLITEFRVLVRPLQAVNMLHKMMGEMLKKMNKQ